MTGRVLAVIGLCAVLGGIGWLLQRAGRADRILADVLDTELSPILRAAALRVQAAELRRKADASLDPLVKANAAMQSYKLEEQARWLLEGPP